MGKYIQFAIIYTKSLRTILLLYQDYGCRPWTFALSHYLPHCQSYLGEALSVLQRVMVVQVGTSPGLGALYQWGSDAVRRLSFQNPPHGP